MPKKKRAPSGGTPDRSLAELEKSVAVRIERLRAKLGKPFREDSRLSAYETALEGADEATSRIRPRPPKVELLARADALLAAHEIALAVITRRTSARIAARERECPPRARTAADGAASREIEARSSRDAWENVAERASLLFDVESIARGHVRTAGGFKSLEQAFFTSWNESPPSETKGFWRKVEAAGLPYVRRDLLAEIFARGRIGSREHYEHAVDLIGVAEEEGLLDAAGVERLGRLIAAYESK